VRSYFASEEFDATLLGYETRERTYAFREWLEHAQPIQIGQRVAQRIGAYVPEEPNLSQDVAHLAATGELDKGLLARAVSAGEHAARAQADASDGTLSVPGAAAVPEPAGDPVGADGGVVSQDEIDAQLAELGLGGMIDDELAGIKAELRHSADPAKSRVPENA
jgi:hypothetical protein